MSGLKTCTVPLAPGAVPVLGHTLAMARDPHKFMRSLVDVDGPVQLRLGPVPVVLATTPALAKAVMIDDATFDKGGVLFDIGREIAGNGLLTCARKDHRRQRRLVQPAFHAHRMPGYARIMTRYADRVTARWRDGDTIDVQAELTSITAGIALETMFAQEPTATRVQELIDNMRTVVSGAFVRILTPHCLGWLPIPAKIRYERAVDTLRRSGYTMIDQRRADGAGDHGDLLSMLLTNAGSGEEGLSDDEVVDQIMSFYFGGIETTTTVTSWSSDLLARNPEVQRELQHEVDRVLGGRAATHDDLEGLRLTRNVVLEAMRLYPPAWFLTRRVTRPTHLGGHLVPKGTSVAVSTYLLHRRPDVYPEPARFDPKRWENGEPAKKKLLQRLRAALQRRRLVHQGAPGRPRRGDGRPAAVGTARPPRAGHPLRGR